jgi:hypothetical protein
MSLKMSNLLEEAIKKQSRLLGGVEVIDACDIILAENGYKAVPDEIIGKRRLDVDMKPVRRWYGLLTELNKRQK